MALEHKRASLRYTADNCNNAFAHNIHYGYTPIIMSRRNHHLLHIALIFLVLISFGDARTHLCLDGQETSPFVYFENFGGTPYQQHDDDDDVHVDIEADLTAQMISGPSSYQDVAVFLLAYSSLFLDSKTRAAPPSYSYLDASYSSPPQTLPPPRGPPFLV